MIARAAAGLALGMLTMAGSTLAHAAPGDHLIAEFDSGSVLEFSTGGDLSGATRFATGLSAPLGLCVGPGGEIYVAESGSGQVTIITEGGDFGGAEPFASGPFSPVELWCNETIVLVSDPLLPMPLVVDITQGGDLLATGDIHATGLPLPTGMARDGAGLLYSANFDVFDITKPGGYEMAVPFATGRSLTTLTFTGMELWGGDSTAPEIYDLTGGGDLSAAAPAVVLPTVGLGHIDGLLTTAGGIIYAATGSQIYDISAGGDLQGATPFATGLATGERGFIGMLEHVCSADADCADPDACNGVELCVDNRCVAPQGPLDCDDVDSCTADTCDPIAGCSHAPVGGCCNEDLDCPIDEFCDIEQELCVPVSVVTTGADDTGGDVTGGSGGTGETTTDTDTEGGAAAEGESDGCGCRSGDGDPTWWSMLTLLGVIRRRP